MTKYDAQFKLKVVKGCLKTDSQYPTAKLYGIGTSDVRRWTLVHQYHGLQVYKNKPAKGVLLSIRLRFCSELSSAASLLATL